ncbi:MAG: hypothetical protein IJ861_03505 [Clostridia bacterium]|nr:hypothetical protein [Clostridia bacterium]
MNKNTIRRMEIDSGFSFTEMLSLSPYAERKVIEKKTGKKLIFSKLRDFRKLGRGNPLIARREIATMEEVDKELSGIKWNWNRAWK